MNELSLFTGAGGGLLGTHHLLGWKTVGMVEIDEYCQRVLRQRQDDGFLDRCPIFGDIREFIQSGAAEQYRGVADVVTAGFPCQPFSVAGKRLGVDDPRNMWPETVAVIRLVRPRFCLLENTPGLLSGGYFGTVLGDLAESGFDARWRVLSAAEVGAPHKRDRIWIMADAGDSGQGHRGERRALRDLNGDSEAAERERDNQQYGADSIGEDVADAGCIRCSRSEAATNQQQSGSSGIGPGCQWSTEPDVGRVAHGISNRVDRLKALGNGQVPQCVATAWRLLTEET